MPCSFSELFRLFKVETDEAECHRQGREVRQCKETIKMLLVWVFSCDLLTIRIMTALFFNKLKVPLTQALIIFCFILLPNAILHLFFFFYLADFKLVFIWIAVLRQQTALCFITYYFKAFSPSIIALIVSFAQITHLLWENINISSVQWDFVCWGKTAD